MGWTLFSFVPPRGPLISDPWKAFLYETAPFKDLPCTLFLELQRYKETVRCSRHCPNSVMKPLRTLPKTTEANLDCVFVHFLHLFFNCDKSE